MVGGTGVGLLLVGDGGHGCHVPVEELGGRHCKAVRLRGVDGVVVDVGVGGWLGVGDV